MSDDILDKDEFLNWFSGRARDMAQCLRAFVVPSEGPDLVPCTHIVAHNFL